MHGRSKIADISELRDKDLFLELRVENFDLAVKVILLENRCVLTQFIACSKLKHKVDRYVSTMLFAKTSSGKEITHTRFNTIT